MRIKSKTVMSCSSRKKKECTFCNAYFDWRKIFWHLCFILKYSVLNKLLEYIYNLTYQKTLLHTFLLLAFKSVESLQCILNIIEKIMRKPLFFFVFSTKNKWNCLVKVLSVNFIKWKALWMMIRLKKTSNQWHFLLIWNICYNKNRLLFQLVTVKIYTVIQTDYCFNWLRRKSTGSSRWEVFLEINRKHWNS